MYKNRLFVFLSVLSVVQSSFEICGIKNLAILRVGVAQARPGVIPKTN
jgi:hypothetical protein